MKDKKQTMCEEACACKNEKAESCECTSCGETEEQYGYYSKVLQKPFDTLDELKEAEYKFKLEQDEKFKAKETRAARAKEVEQAYIQYQEVKTAALNEIAKAERNWLKLRDAFVKDYHGYHLTYTDINGKKQVTFSELLDTLFTF